MSPRAVTGHGTFLALSKSSTGFCWEKMCSFLNLFAKNVGKGVQGARRTGRHLVCTGFGTCDPAPKIMTATRNCGCRMALAQRVSGQCLGTVMQSAHNACANDPKSAPQDSSICFALKRSLPLRGPPGGGPTKPFKSPNIDQNFPPASLRGCV